MWSPAAAEVVCFVKQQLLVSCTVYCMNVSVFHPVAQRVIQQCNLVSSIFSPDVPSMLSFTSAKPQKCCRGAQSKHRDILQIQAEQPAKNQLLKIMMENRVERMRDTHLGGVSGLVSLKQSLKERHHGLCVVESSSLYVCVIELVPSGWKYTSWLT